MVWPIFLGCFTPFFAIFPPRLCLAAFILVGQIRKCAPFPGPEPCCSDLWFVKTRFWERFSLYGFGNPGWGYYLRFVFYCNGSIANLIFQVFLGKREGLFNLSHFLGDISRFRVAFTANVNVRFKVRNSRNRKWTKLRKTAWFMKQFLWRKLA